MKKLHILFTAFVIILIIVLGCKKETATAPLVQGEIATAKPSPPPPPVSILQWQKTYGSSADDIGNSIVINSTSDAYLVAGSTNGNDGDVLGNHGGQDAWVVKTSLTGTILWQTAVGGTGGDNAKALVGTADGGCLIAGQTSSIDGNLSSNHGGGDILLAKLSSSGAVEWAKALGGSGFDNAEALINTSDGGFAIAGQTTSNDGDLAGIGSTNGNGKIWLIKLDNTANIQWQMTYSFDGAKDDVAYSLAQSTDGGYFLVGRTLSISDNADIGVLSVSNAGAVNWARTIGSAGGAGDVGFGVTTTPANDGCVITGYLSYNLMAEKLYNNNTVAWQKTFAGSTTGGIQGRAILSTSQGYIITGQTASKNGDIIALNGGTDMFVLSIDPSGNKIASSVFGGKNNDIGKSLVATPDGAYISAGATYSNNGDVSGNHGGEDVWVVKFKF